MSDETTARVERLRSALEHGCERWEIDDLLRDAIAAIDSYVLRLDTNEQERVKLASWFNEAEQMAGKLQRERDLALRRLDAVRSILLDRFGTGEISPLVAVGLIGKELLLTPTHDDVVRAAAAVVERRDPIENWPTTAQPLHDREHHHEWVMVNDDPPVAQCRDCGEVIRNPEGVLAAIRRAIAVFPDLRVGQLIYNANGGEPFNVEDEALIAKLDAFVKAHSPE
jgi:hypothetical protein